MRWLALFLLALFSSGSALAEPALHVSLVEIEGVINPVTLRIISTALDRAEAEGAQLLIIQLDTPGGLERSMRSIVQKFLRAKMPVAVYVAPTGARAASAGVFITMAAHIAAMAPATNIGAAHPVAVGGAKMDEEVSKKIENDAAAFARSIATERGRNADWAEKAVRESVSITEREAVKLKVIDLIVANVSELLDKIDGRTVKTAAGSVTLKTREVPVRTVAIGWRDRFLNLITDPNIAYMLMMLGMLGLFFELSNPGAIVPGVIGGISLILAFFAFQSLPFNYAGILLILFGIILLLAEIKVTSHGVLTIGGTISMILGSMMLFDAPEIGLSISWWIIVPTVATTTGIFAFAVSYGVQALYRKPTTGGAGMVGLVGVARSPLAPAGDVFVHGEIWRAVAEGEPVAQGDSVTIVRVDGLTLRVKKANGQ
ncbi:MAG: nodulation protein NfeD [Candidatus Methylomirabilia bacterium]